MKTITFNIVKRRREMGTSTKIAALTLSLIISGCTPSEVGSSAIATFVGLLITVALIASFISKRREYLESKKLKNNVYLDPDRCIKFYPSSLNTNSEIAKYQIQSFYFDSMTSTIEISYSCGLQVHKLSLSATSAECIGLINLDKLLTFLR